MLEQVKQVLVRYEQLTAQLNAPETYGDPALSARLLREQKQLFPLAASCRRHMQLHEDLAAAQDLGLSQA